MRTPTNPKVNIKFTRALQECGNSRSNEKIKEKQPESKKPKGPEAVINDKFEEIFGLLARDNSK